MMLRRFNAAGMAEFRRFLEECREKPVELPLQSLGDAALIRLLGYDWTYTTISAFIKLLLPLGRERQHLAALVQSEHERANQKGKARMDAKALKSDQERQIAIHPEHQK